MMQELKHVTPAPGYLPTTGLPPGHTYVNWRPQLGKDKNGDPKWLKVPSPPTNSDDLLTPQEAVKRALAAPPGQKGVGIALKTDHTLIAIDVDNVPLAEHAQLKRLLTEHPTYIEATPSGAHRHRFRILYNVDTKENLRSKPVVFSAPASDSGEKQEIQVYVSTGYTTLTGEKMNSLMDFQEEIADISQADLVTLWPAIVQPTQSEESEGEEELNLEAMLSKMRATQPKHELELWVQIVELDPQNARVQLMMEQQGWNHYEYWLTGLMAINAAFGQAGLMQALAWSHDKDPDNFDQDSFLSTWQSLSPDEKGITAKTYEMFWHFFTPSWPLPDKAGKPRPAEMMNFKYWLEFNGLEFKVDAVSQAVFLDGPESVLVPTYYTSMTEQLTSSLDDKNKLVSRLNCGETHKMDYLPSAKQLHDLIGTVVDGIDVSQRVNRWGRYIDSFEWDGKDRVTILARDIIKRNAHFKHPTQEFQELLIKKWLWSCLRSIWPDRLAPAHRGQSAEGMLIMSGAKGGIGKSTLPSDLFPVNWKHLETMVTPQMDAKYENKDYLATIAPKLITNIDEVDKIFSSKTNACFKSLITKPTLEYRPPYARNVKRNPTVNSYYSSTNREQMTLAREGARRWWWINVDDIKLGVVKDWSLRDEGKEIMQLWAQVADGLITASNAEPYEKPPWVLDDKEVKYLLSYITEHTSQTSAAMTLMDAFIMTPEAIQEKYEAVRSGKIRPALAACTMCAKEINEALGNTGNHRVAGLKHTLREELKKICPPELGLRKATLKYGITNSRGQDRYFMPPMRSAFDEEVDYDLQESLD